MSLPIKFVLLNCRIVSVLAGEPSICIYAVCLHILMYQLQRGSGDLWGSVNHCENVTLQLSLVEIENRMWATIGKDNRNPGKSRSMIILLHKPPCASDLHAAQSFVHSASENSMEAVEGQEGGVWEPRCGWMLFKKSLNISGKITAERAVITLMIKDESTETVAAASHHWKTFKDFLKRY